jgi:hypothetical protein
MLKNLLGGGSKSAEMQAILQQMQEAIARYEKLATGADRTADRFARLGEPIEKATGEVNALVTRLSDPERRFEDGAALELLRASTTARQAHARPAEGRNADRERPGRCRARPLDLRGPQPQGRPRH